MSLYRALFPLLFRKGSCTITCKSGPYQNAPQKLDTLWKNIEKNTTGIKNMFITLYTCSSATSRIRASSSWLLLWTAVLLTFGFTVPYTLHLKTLIAFQFQNNTIQFDSFRCQYTKKWTWYLFVNCYQNHAANSGNFLHTFLSYTSFIFSLHFDKTKLSLEAFSITELFQIFNTVVKHTTSKSDGFLIYCCRNHQFDTAICCHSRLMNTESQLNLESFLFFFIYLH